MLPVAKKLEEVYGRKDLRKSLKSWRQNCQKNGGLMEETRGKKTADEFEIALLSELVFVAAGSTSSN